MSDSTPQEHAAREGHSSTATNDVAVASASAGTDGNTPVVGEMSPQASQSHIRHQHRASSHTRQPVIETRNARSQYSNSEDDGTAQHRINQYVIGQEIGRGSFGAVHLATDQYGTEFAVKEFSKSRLRRRVQSHLLRRPDRFRGSGQVAAGQGFNSPLHRHGPGEATADNSLDLIKEEMAIMKKLSHPNVVNLFEVLDDPDEDSLYMVLEMCKKGVVMKVGLEAGRADPYDEETCRRYFRDMILGIEYLHAQGIVHRDIKPDNCLVTHDEVLKIVDFGVSEMFGKDTDMTIGNKSSGSPAFMPPELCVAHTSRVSGSKADIWSMGATLYCLRQGHIPFEKTSIMELYQSIRDDDIELPSELEEPYRDLMTKLLEKDPSKRITMDEVRVHPWVTKNGLEPLISKEDNTANLVEPPNEEEIKTAITSDMSKLFIVMKAVKRFKNALFRRRPELMESIFGTAARIVQPPLSLFSSTAPVPTHSSVPDERKSAEASTTSEYARHDIDSPTDVDRESQPADHGDTSKDIPYDTKSVLDPPVKQDLRPESHSIPSSASTAIPSAVDGKKGHAHDPLSETLFLNIGTHAPDVDESSSSEQNDAFLVSESPGAAAVNIYELAYQEEIERITSERYLEPTSTLYLNRRVDDIKHIRETVHAAVEEALREHKDRFNDAFNEHRERLGSQRDKATEIYQAEGAIGLAKYGGQGLSKVVAKARDEARRQVGEASRKREEGEKATGQQDSLAAKFKSLVTAGPATAKSTAPDPTKSTARGDG